MNFAFRSDASLKIGAGHLMRCLTLANCLRQEGHHCHFVFRDLEGHMEGLISENNFSFSRLPAEKILINEDHNDQEVLPEHYHLLEYSWKEDAKQTVQVLKNSEIDWLVVDHYALDGRWQSQLRDYCKRLMVIDDLADRQHICDLLFDQTLGRNSSSYENFVPKECQFLLGSQYALLRPEFREYRKKIELRGISEIKEILITLGGADPRNVTGDVLKIFAKLNLKNITTLNIVLGHSSPWVDSIKEQVKNLNYKSNIMIDIKDMAATMSKCDLVISASGSTAWERCCLGLPGINIVVEKNQIDIAKSLEISGAAITLNYNSINFGKDLFEAVKKLMNSSTFRKKMIKNAAKIVDGSGASRVLERLIDFKPIIN